jgi:hypothetical protein
MGKHKRKKIRGEHKEKKEDKSIKKEKEVDFLFIFLLLSIVFLINLPFARLELMSPDASGYLDMGRNLFSGKGAVISYNLNQYWLNKYYPFLPYMHPVFPIIAGLIWILSGLKTVIGFNIFLLAINCLLLYKILRLNVDSITSFLIAIFMGFSQNTIWTAIYPWTEQLHLFFLLLAIFIYLRYPKTLFWVGVIFAVSLLTRVASVYNILAFAVALIVLQGFSKDAVKEYIKIALGFLVVFLPYEAICYIRYGSFYPQYLGAAKIYRSAEIYPGAIYKGTIPVLNTPPLNLSKDIIFANIRNNFMGFIKIFENMKFVFIVVPLYIIFDLIKRKTPWLIIFFFQGLFVFVGYALSHFWSPLYEFTRLSLISFITLGTIGFLSLKEIISWFFSERLKEKSSFLFIIIILIFFCFQLKDYVSFRNYWMSIYPQKYEDYKKHRDEMYSWIKLNTEKNALIASEFLSDPFFFERPFVSLPPGKALNVKNIVDFLNIYKPDYILTFNESLIKFLKSIGFKEVRKSGKMVLLGINKN